MIRCEFLFRDGVRCQRKRGHFPPEPHSWEWAAEELVAAALAEMAQRVDMFMEGAENTAEHWEGLAYIPMRNARANLRALLNTDAAQPPTKESK